MKFILGMLAIYAVGAVLIVVVFTDNDARDWIVKQWPEIGAGGK